jgi:hypothetical protein
MGRKPVGKKAMTDAERQQRRRQRLRQAKANSVTDGMSRNGDRTDAAVLEALRKKIEQLEKQNKRLYEDAKGWKNLSEMERGEAARLRNEKEILRHDLRKYENLQSEMRKFELDKQLFEMEKLFNPSVVKTWIRQLTMRYHPDRGGSQEEMKVVNAAYELLKQLLGQ